MDIYKDKSFVTGKTKNYDLFKLIDVNRDPRQSHLNKLEKSIKANGLQVPIILNEDKQIIDGQHRYWVCQKLGYTIPYVIKPTINELEEDILEINKNQVGWNTIDYAHKAAIQGNLDAEAALRISEEWRSKTSNKLSQISTLEILKEGRSHTGLLKSFKNLTYKMDKESGEEIFEILTTMSHHPDKIQGNPFTQKFTRTIKALNHDLNGLNLDVIESICSNHYLQSLSSETEQYLYLKDLYDKNLKKISKN